MRAEASAYRVRDAIYAARDAGELSQLEGNREMSVDAARGFATELMLKEGIKGVRTRVHGPWLLIEPESFGHHAGTDPAQ